MLWQHARVHLEERLKVAEELRVVREGERACARKRENLSDVTGPLLQLVYNSTEGTTSLLAACTGRDARLSPTPLDQGQNNTQTRNGFHAERGSGTAPGVFTFLASFTGM